MTFIPSPRSNQSSIRSESEIKNKINDPDNLHIETYEFFQTGAYLSPCPSLRATNFQLIALPPEWPQIGVKKVGNQFFRRGTWFAGFSRSLGSTLSFMVDSNSRDGTYAGLETKLWLFFNIILDLYFLRLLNLCLRLIFKSIFPWYFWRGRGLKQNPNGFRIVFNLYIFKIISVSVLQLIRFLIQLIRARFSSRAHVSWSSKF